MKNNPVGQEGRGTMLRRLNRTGKQTGNDFSLPPWCSYYLLASCRYDRRLV